jgi:hypothetical protein
MTQHDELSQKRLPGKFLRFLGLFWVGVVGLALLGNALAPHLGRGTDVLLQYVWHRDWTVLTLAADQPFFDPSTPESTIKSYYSALYHGDAARLTHLTQGPFSEQMRRRLQAGEMATGQQPVTYRSYIATRMHADGHAEVHEKFHLFWQYGLRFTLQRGPTAWHIVAVDSFPEE